MRTPLLVILTIIIYTSCALFDNPHLDIYSMNNAAGEEYRIYIMQTRPGETVKHVIYVLDGDWNASIVYQQIEQYEGNNMVVGIGYPDTTRRLFDYTPTDNGVFTSGGSDVFFQFIRDSVNAMIDEKYGIAHLTRNERFFLGHSLGGLCAIYCLYTANDIAGSFVAISPAIDWDMFYIYGVKELYSDSVDGDWLNLYSSMGALESDAFINDFNVFTQAIASDSNINLFTEIINYRDHNTVVKPSIKNAFAIFNDMGVF